MSHVTDTILCFGVHEKEEKCLENINAFLSEMPKLQKGKGLVLLNTDLNSYGGTKVLQANVCVAALNHLDISAFLDFLTEYSWEERRKVQVFFKDEHDYMFRTWSCP